MSDLRYVPATSGAPRILLAEDDRELRNMIARHLRREQLVILESTTYPGTTEEILLPRFEQNSLRAGEDFFLAYSPERVDPGNPQFQTHNIPKVVGGVTDDSTAVAAHLYSQIVKDVFAVSSARVAEAAKLLENTFRAVNIGLVNELALMCDRLKIDVWEVVDAAATKPFGFMPFYPGPGLSGWQILEVFESDAHLGRRRRAPR